MYTASLYFSSCILLTNSAIVYSHSQQENRCVLATRHKITKTLYVWQRAVHADESMSLQNCQAVMRFLLHFRHIVGCKSGSIHIARVPH